MSRRFIIKIYTAPPSFVSSAQPDSVIETTEALDEAFVFNSVIDANKVSRSVRHTNSVMPIKIKIDN